MQNLIFTLNTIAPVFLIVFLGIGLKRARMIDDHFIKVSSQIVFNVTLPALVFSEIATTNYSEVLHAGQIGFACAGVLVSCTIAWILSSFICQNGRDQGAFIQGSFRSNFSILGFALIYNAFGQTALANAAVLLAFIMPLLNILSVIVLAVPMHRENQINLRHTGLSLLKNPLILSAFAAIPFSYFQIHIPGMLIGTVKYLAAMTLPLALLGIGESPRRTASQVKPVMPMTFPASRPRATPRVTGWVAASARSMPANLTPALARAKMGTTAKELHGWRARSSRSRGDTDSLAIAARARAPWSTRSCPWGAATSVS